MNVTVSELMTSGPMALTRHQSASHAADLMRRHGISALPVVGPDGEPLGIVTSSDLLADRPETTPLSNFMSTPVYTVAPGDGPHIAARVMRNHHLHHVVVVDHHRVVGMVSAYDLLALVEDHRYTAKQAPTRATKPPRRR